MTTQRLAGRRALVTAGAAGIGYAIARTFAAEGAWIALCDLPGEGLDRVTAEHPDWLAVPADVSDEDAVDALFAAIDDRLGCLDILVNNAGIAGPTAPVERVAPAEWRRTLDVNLYGMFLATRAAVPRLRAAGGGAIVNLSSSAGRFAFPLRSPYAASKWGVVGFTRSVAAEVGPDGITVNAILPGLVAGDRLDRVIAARAVQNGRPVEEERRRLFDRVAMGRGVEVDDIAAAALFLAGREARFITGEAIGVDAGLFSLA